MLNKKDPELMIVCLLVALNGDPESMGQEQVISIIKEAEELYRKLEK